MLKLPGKRLSDEQFEAVSRMMARARKEPTFLYPWDTLGKKSEEKGVSEISFVAYGSLLNAQSAARTLQDLPHKDFLPVIAFGVRRLFNYQMPPNIPRYGPPKQPMARAALNTRFTDKIEDAVNGLLVKWPLNDIPALRTREVGYDLIPIACLDWVETEKPPFIAYILRSPDELRVGKRFTNNEITPHQEYYKVCREGARTYGEDFLHFFLEATYLADGVTPVAAWEIAGFPKEEIEK